MYSVNVNERGRQAVAYRACILLSLRLCVNYEHETKDCGKVKSHASCRPTFAFSHISAAEIWRLQCLWPLAILYKQCHIVLSCLYLRFTEAVLHKHSFTASMIFYLATVLCSVFVANAEPERECDIRTL